VASGDFFNRLCWVMCYVKKMHLCTLNGFIISVFALDRVLASQLLNLVTHGNTAKSFLKVVDAFTITHKNCRVESITKMTLTNV